MLIIGIVIGLLLPPTVDLSNYVAAEECGYLCEGKPKLVCYDEYHLEDCEAPQAECWQSCWAHWMDVTEPMQDMHDFACFNFAGAEVERDVY
jgi:hypothetical protein